MDKTYVLMLPSRWWVSFIDAKYLRNADGGVINLKKEYSTALNGCNDRILFKTKEDMLAFKLKYGF